MSSRPILAPFSVLSAESMGASFSSEPTFIPNISAVSYEASWSGSTPIGTLAVEVSNSVTTNADGSIRNAGNWTVLTSTAVSGNTGSIFFDVTITAGLATRLTYTRSSGTGSMDAIVNGKVS